MNDVIDSFFVGVAGFEPTTPCSQSDSSTVSIRLFFNQLQWRELSVSKIFQRALLLSPYFYPLQLII